MEITEIKIKKLVELNPEIFQNKYRIFIGFRELFEGIHFTVGAVESAESKRKLFFSDSLCQGLNATIFSGIFIRLKESGNITSTQGKVTIFEEAVQSSQFNLVLKNKLFNYAI